MTATTEPDGTANNHNEKVRFTPVLSCNIDKNLNGNRARSGSGDSRKDGIL